MLKGYPKVVHVWVMIFLLRSDGTTKTRSFGKCDRLNVDGFLFEKKKMCL